MNAKQINKLNKLDTHITPPGETKYGTRFDKMLPISRAGAGQPDRTMNE